MSGTPNKEAWVPTIGTDSGDEPGWGALPGSSLDALWLAQRLSWLAMVVDQQRMKGVAAPDWEDDLALQDETADKKSCWPAISPLADADQSRTQPRPRAVLFLFWERLYVNSSRLG